MNSTNATHCLLQCYDSELTVAAYNFSLNSLQCLADQVTQSPAMNRTVWNIIWSSLTTIFACTWISCHPNFDFDDDMLMKMEQEQEQQKQEQQEQEQWKQTLNNLTQVQRVQLEQKIQWDLRHPGGPEQQEGLKRSWWSGLQKLLKIKIILVTLIKWCWSSHQKVTRAKIVTFIKWCWPSNRMMTRVKIILVALIAPEFIVMWALRQYMVAKNIVKICKGWTMTHAFFSLMGGFVIANKEQDPICALVLEPHADYTFQSKLKDSWIDIENRFKVLASAIMSLEASTLSVDAAAETLAEILVGDIWEVVIGQGMLVSGALFEYKEASKYLHLNALETVQAVFQNTERVLADDLSSGGLSQLQRDLWDNSRDEIRVILRTKVSNKLLDMHQNIWKTLAFCPKEEIEDKTKRDWLAKTFALAQTTWFVVQCIARRAQHLPLAEIELMTCAYAALSAAIYAFWWHKPFGVQYPIIVRTEIPHTEREMHPTVKPNPWNITALARFLAGSAYNEVDFQRRVRVPTFYSGYFLRASSDFWNFLIEVTIAAAFGGIHLFAWNYQFPTQIELWLWRVSALIIVGVPPIAVMPISILAGSADQLARHRSLCIISKILLPIFVLLYIVARLSILVLSLVSLRRLPVGTLANVDWLSFIPHID